MLGNKGFFVFSVSHKDDSAAHNEFRTGNTIEQLLRADIPFKTVKGVYKGFKETSFVVPAKHEKVVLELATSSNQESILFVNGKSQASLYFIDGDGGFLVEKLGTFTEVPREAALESDNYTFDDVEEIYYMVK